MNRRTHRSLIVAACAILLVSAALMGCRQLTGTLPAEQEPLELRTYEVPPDYQDELRSMLRSALEAENVRVGRVTSGPGGTLLVVAPARIQAGVSQILDKGFDVPPIASPVKLTYWLLVGRPVDPASGKQPLSMTGGRHVPQLDPVLSEIVSAQGPTEFALLEHVQMTSVNQARAQTNGNFSRITQRATRTGEQIVSEVEIQLDGNAIQTQVMLQRNQFLVLGQAGFGGQRGEAFPDAANGETLTLYYVMAADLES